MRSVIFRTGPQSRSRGQELMPVSLSISLNDIILLLNAGTPGTYSGTVIDPRWNTQQIVDLILSGDAMVCQATYRNKDNSRAALYYTIQTGIAHGQSIGAAAGPIASVQFVVTGGTSPGSRQGVEWDADEIQNEIANPLSLTLIEPHFSFDGRVLYHNGSVIAANSGGGAVSVNVTYPTFTLTSACQAASEYQDVVTSLGMKSAVPVEGSNVQAAELWQKISQIYLGAVSTGEAAIPNLRQLVKQ